MKQQIIILSANPYSIRDEASGRTNEGVSVSYLMNADLEPVFGENGTLGVRPAKGTLAKAQLSNITAAPALYEAELDMSIGSDGRPALRIKEVQYVSCINAVPVKKEGK